MLPNFIRMDNGVGADEKFNREVETEFRMHLLDFLSQTGEWILDAIHLLDGASA
jgi:hypothetical protein